MTNTSKHPSSLAIGLMCLVLAGCSGGGSAVSAINSTVSDAVSTALSVPSVTDIANLAVVPMLSPQSGSLAPGANPADPLSTSPQATTVTSLANAAQAVKIYTPAQIRSAYRLPSLPTSWSNLTSAQQADMGAGQTIYIIAAQDDPNVVSELSTFSRQFNLPACSNVSIAPTQSLPLPAATSSGCQFSVVYSSGTGMTTTAPGYDSNWAMEIALDVQWAHATAPLARIVLIEAANPTTPSMLNAINLANAMGPGVVSMSFGTPEGSWVNAMDSVFSAANMSYVAASGDSSTVNGAQWPSVSSHVLAVGGTSLSGYTSTTRTETVWSSTGGGRSQFVTAPTYQNALVPGMGNQTLRSVADVAFNADPYTGQYVAVMPQGQSSVVWYSMGGTSLGTPQWAAIVAIANARRALNSQAMLGPLQSLIYPASSASGFYGSSFNDITIGSSGSFSAGIGYDIPSGLGTPNSQSLLTLVAGNSGSGAVASAPILSSNLTLSAVAGSALSFSVSYTAANSVTWSISGAASGMSIDPSSGIISWANPVAGTYRVSVQATDNVTQLTGTATVTLNISPATAPIVQNTTIQGYAGIPLAYRLSVISKNPVSYSFSANVPSGMTASSNGLLSWLSPVAGTYPVNVTVTDTQTGASATATITLQIGTAPIYSGPTISASAISGTAGSPLTSVIGISDKDPGVKTVSVSIKGSPAGMNFGASAQGILVRWMHPVSGTYNLLVTATDNLSPSHSSQANITVTIH